jgi:hypothetical protein
MVVMFTEKRKVGGSTPPLTTSPELSLLALLPANTQEGSAFDNEYARIPIQLGRARKP